MIYFIVKEKGSLRQELYNFVLVCTYIFAYIISFTTSVYVDNYKVVHLQETS